MKMIQLLIVLLAILTSSIRTYAIEGLKIKVQNLNAILSWPSTNTETYIVQYATNLNLPITWVTLTDLYPASVSGNITYYTNFNSVFYPMGLVSGGGGDITPLDSGEILAVPNNGSIGNAAPLVIYPVGFDLSNFTIYNSLTGESVSGKGYVITGSQTPAGQPNNSSSSTNQNCGFYRVVRDGAHVYGLTNGATLSGVITMPIEISVTSTDSIQGITFYNSADDSPVIGTTSSTTASGSWVFNWDTTQVPNGTYTIYPEVDFTTDNPVISSNIPVTVNVNNTISFPNYFTQIYGSQMWIYAETIPNASYTIDMYDEGTNYLGTFADYADGNGVISFIWDLTDGSGNTYNSTNFYGVFTVTYTNSPMMPLARINNTNSSPKFQKLGQKSTTLKSGGIIADASSSASATHAWAQEVSSWWGYGDGFVIAYASLTDPILDPNTTTKEGLMVVGGDGGIYGGVVSSLSQYGLSYQLSPGNVAQTSAFLMGNSTDKSNLLSYIASYTYRNFYFFGHGNPTVFSGINEATAINQYTIAKILNNFMTGTKLQNYHPYRFVFIDGCDTGKGKFCESFGIPAQTVNNNFFATAGVRSRAFISYKKSVNFNTAQWDWRSIMLGTFFSQWQVNTPVYSCMTNAQAALYQPMDQSAVIYGALDLQKNSP